MFFSFAACYAFFVTVEYTTMTHLFINLIQLNSNILPSCNSLLQTTQCLEMFELLLNYFNMILKLKITHNIHAVFFLVLKYEKKCYTYGKFYFKKEKSC